MSALPPVNPVRNRAILADRMGWPDEALALCIIVESEFPEWDVFWTRGGLAADPDPGYRAMLQRHNQKVLLFGETIEVLRAQIAEVRGEPASRWPSYRR